MINQYLLLTKYLHLMLTHLNQLLLLMFHYIVHLLLKFLMNLNYLNFHLSQNYHQFLNYR